MAGSGTLGTAVSVDAEIREQKLPLAVEEFESGHIGGTATSAEYA
jgi:hypothetical protein